MEWNNGVNCSLVLQAGWYTHFALAMWLVGRCWERHLWLPEELWKAMLVCSSPCSSGVAAWQLWSLVTAVWSNNSKSGGGNCETQGCIFVLVNELLRLKEKWWKENWWRVRQWYLLVLWNSQAALMEMHRIFLHSHVAFFKLPLVDVGLISLFHCSHTCFMPVKIKVTNLSSVDLQQQHHY